MSQENNQSNFDLLKGRWTFKNEPLWFKLLVFICTILFFLALAWILTEGVQPVLTAKKLAFIITKLLKLIK